MMFADVLIASQTRKTDRPFTYRVPEALQAQAKEGRSVVVPFGRGDRRREGLVIRLFEADAPEYPTKDIFAWKEGQPLSEEAMAIAHYMVEHDLSDQTSAIQTVLPPGGVGAFRPRYSAYYRRSEKGKNAEISARAPRQKAVLEVLGEGEWEQKDLLQKSGATKNVLDRLLEQGLIEKAERRVMRRQVNTPAAYRRQILTPDQQKVFDHITEKKGIYLLRGVTGSGKTEIYLQLVERALDQGKQAIVLVPEISLTPQTIARFEGRFGPQVAILHSRLSTAERYEEWEKIQSGEVSIAIGARSAIFAPFSDLGIIIIDEEHESSYVSEKNPKYHADEIAAFRANWHRCSFVLGSATPSLLSLYRAEKGEIERLDLPERVHGRPMPETEIVDMRAELKANNRTMFSRALRMAMLEALRNKEQIILFLNRRGHTSYVFCRDCGYVYRCDACDVAMTYHKHHDHLVCHYCGREKKLQTHCPQCGSDRIRAFGAGTEQLEEETRRLFPGARIRRADLDTMRAKGAYDSIYRDMMDGSIDILLGTQMIAKGFDFPRVTVVGIIAADVSLNQPDVRAGERTFQLVTQVAGRAGRDERPGKVFIQTYKPTHPALVAAQAHDVDYFYETEIAYREENGYPPFRHELHVLLSGPDRAKTMQRAQGVAAFLEEKIKTDALIGPTPSIIERMNGRYRFTIVLRQNDRALLESIGKALIDVFPTSTELWVVVTIDPLRLD